MNNSSSLVRTLEASEKIGASQELLISKTGVLTKNKDLTVERIYAEK